VLVSGEGGEAGLWPDRGVGYLVQRPRSRTASCARASRSLGGGFGLADRHLGVSDDELPMLAVAECQ
jgi:hypothetical protein